jgi:hypothetical protein
MLVYSVALLLKKTSSVESVLGVVSRWLSRKANQPISAVSLQSTSQSSLREGGLQVVSSDSSFPMLQSIRYTHRDRVESGRQWVIEVGIRRQRVDSEIECSVLLRTDEISTQVETKVQPTVPVMVHDILRHCSPSGGTPGLSTITLDNDNEVEAFGYAIEYHERRHPYVLVSPTADEKYLIDIERLRYLLEGLADVIQIPIGADTFLIERVLGKQYAAWRGAINLIFPEVQLLGRRFAPTRRLLPDEIGNLFEEGANPETEILSLVTHRTNIPNSRRHISPETVAETIRRRELARSQKEASATGESAKYIELLEEDGRDRDQKIEKYQHNISQLQDDINALNGIVTQIDDENRQLRFEREGLKLTLSHVGGSGDEGLASGVSNPMREVLLNIASDSFTPRKSLLVISRLFPDRVAILESAWKSADDSETFKERKKGFDLLWKMVTDYWDALANGTGDAEARNVFGNAYSARESETVETNKRARKLRTFNYKGRNLEMMRHLKIGVKDSVAETLRVHFEWDASARKIVIGHCGPHLAQK